MDANGAAGRDQCGNVCQLQKVDRDVGGRPSHPSTDLRFHERSLASISGQKKRPGPIATGTAHDGVGHGFVLMLFSLRDR